MHLLSKISKFLTLIRNILEEFNNHTTLGYQNISKHPNAGLTIKLVIT